MSKSAGKADNGKIAAHVESALARSLSSMAGKDFTVVVETGTDVGDFSEPIVWQQTFSHDIEPAFWLAAGRDLWSAAGQMTLSAVGIDSIADEDCRSTWQEILGQTMGAIASGLTVDVQTEITAARGEEVPSLPADLAPTVFCVSTEEGQSWYVQVAWSSSISALYEQPEQAQTQVAVRDAGFSKTFDLLLDVALPVSVSFGRTHLQIREVLKLNTGSIVELNRFVVEPVDVIVNDCVIARGEVVVVDGNYGVRVTQLASREDRLRTGMDTATRVGAGAR